MAVDLSVFDNDPTLYLYTSLTAGSSHIITATSRIETILKANKIPFVGVDTAIDERARQLYGRRASGRKLPLLVKQGYVIADLEQVEEWNEYGELKESIGPVPGAAQTPASTPAKPAAPTPSSSTTTPQKQENKPPQSPQAALAMRQASAEAAAAAAARKPAPANISTTNPLLAEKVNAPSTPSKASATPTKASTAGAIRSPRSIPLPATPTAAAGSASGIPKPGEPFKAKLPDRKSVV